MKKNDTRARALLLDSYHGSAVMNLVCEALCKCSGKQIRSTFYLLPACGIASQVVTKVLAQYFSKTGNRNLASHTSIKAQRRESGWIHRLEWNIEKLDVFQCQVMIVGNSSSAFLSIETI